MPQATLIYCTYPDTDTARAAANDMLQTRLAACCTILPAGESHYRWEGNLTAAAEVVMLCKTSPAKADAAMARLAAIHPYECPAILSFPAETSGPFSAWIAAETADPAKNEFQH